MAQGESYEEFVKKFERKVTTDDCYTPPKVYAAVYDYVDKKITPLQGKRVLRPFQPSGDYEREDYTDAIVVDNPPFSILAKIIDFYLARNIPFFLFAPHLTLFNYLNRPRVTALVMNASVIYENGAVVNTSFITNMIEGNPAFILDGDFYEALRAAVKEGKEDKRMPKLAFPACVVTAAQLGNLANKGISWRVERESVHHTRNAGGRALFGSGLLLSDAVTLQREALQREALREVTTYELTAREKFIQKGLK